MYQLHVCLIVLVLLAALWYATTPRRVPSGLWMGVPAFLDDSGLSEAQLYVGERGEPGWLYMKAADGTVVADAPATVAPSWSGLVSLDDKLFGGPVEYDLGSGDRAGMLKFYRGESVFLYLWRDPVASLAASVV
jgi:hypothetical protein